MTHLRLLLITTALDTAARILNGHIRPDRTNAMEEDLTGLYSQLERGAVWVDQSLWVIQTGGLHAEGSDGRNDIRLSAGLRRLALYFRAADALKQAEATPQLIDNLRTEARELCVTIHKALRAVRLEELCDVAASVGVNPVTFVPLEVPVSTSWAGQPDGMDEDLVHVNQMVS